MPTEPPRLVVASGNRGKVAEISAALSDLEITLVSQAELGVGPVGEPASTFVENALIKARHAAAATGLPVLADDSGLLVDALHGAPGVRSARYAGLPSHDTANNARLLDALRAVPDPERGAHFLCVLVVLRHAGDPDPLIVSGRWQGSILSAPRGDGGFGYDPLFFDPESACSAAELSAAAKNHVSHRGQALAQLRTMLPAWLRVAHVTVPA